ncbi:histone-lysine N-methyltransferase 2D [Fundulus heteroclitus]|uniref:histone-lysine N-methyltransferase 2D n=1 Tax=Fundulus heteroclitus TaxID=8078 RepID=UPI00165BF591|nr:histone-lysine N-methyltransferase 2D [Fundulus heteroclitus]
MPSEAQEPRDRGPPPPVTRAGAKAAATSSALEKRPRGRPRKDGSNGRKAAPPPPPPPPPASRKKGRSRGRAQVEDEESKGPPEKNRAQKKSESKEPKEPEEAKPTGRRRSTSRGKSHMVPDPGPEFSPCPEPDRERSSEVAPVSQEESKTGPAPAAPIPETVPEEGPPVRPPYPDCRPDPEPGEDTQPSLSNSPAPLEGGCGPGTTEPEEGRGVGGMEQNPAPSPRCASPASLCLQLEDEDEDSLSPLFQHSPSDEAGGSPTPSLALTKKRLKQCAFCYRGDQPPLGQGRLVVFGPTPGYIPLHILNRRASSDRDDDCHDHCYRGDPAPAKCSSPAQCEDESSSEFMKQLGPIGLPHDINVQSLFDPTGQCCAHLQCAAWSEGVRQGDGQSLLYVDKAIDLGSTQVCGFCRRLGASLRCQYTRCGRRYHFPCAAAAGAHQDWTQRLTLCSRHAPADSSRCVLCSGGAGPGGLLMCCCCGNCYHGSCLDPARSPSPLRRAGWQCPDCRVCHGCRSRADEAVLLVCKRCDKAYHTHCLTPPLDHTPSKSWTCKNCRVCRRCGVTSSGQWANHQFLCESCDPGLPCPLCDRSLDLFSPQENLTCSSCYRPLEEPLVLHSPIPVPPTETSLSLSQLHTEIPPPSRPAHSPVQLFCSETPQSPTRKASQPSLHNLSTPLPDLSEQSLKPSSRDHQRLSSAVERLSMPGPCNKDLQLTPPQSPSSLKDSQAPPDEVLERKQSSPIELQTSPTPSTKEPHQCLVLSPEHIHLNSSLSSAKYDQLPSPSFDQCLEQSANKTQQSPAAPSVETHQSPTTAPPGDSHQSPATPPAETHQSPATAPLELPHSCPAIVPQEESYQSPATSPPEESHQSSATAPPGDSHQSPATPPAETHQSPATAPPEEAPSESPPPSSAKASPEESHQSPASDPPEESHRSPATAPPESPHQSPATLSVETHQSPPTAPPGDSHQSPATPPAETHQSPATAPPEEAPSESPPPSSAKASPEESHQSPASDPTEESHRSPATASPEEAPSESLHPCSATASPEESHQSPASDPPEESYRSPATSPPEESHRSPATPPLEEAPAELMHSSPAMVPQEEFHQSPASAPPEESHQSPAMPPPEEAPSESPPPCSATASPEESHQRPASAPPEESHRSPATPPPEEAPAELLHPSPAMVPQEEFHQSPATPSAETHQSPTSAPPEESHRSPAMPPPEEAPPKLPPLCSATASVEESPQSTAMSPPEFPHQSPSMVPQESPHPSPATGPPKESQSPATPSAETHQSPAMSPPESLNPSPATVPQEELHPRPGTASSEEFHQSPATAALELLHPSPSTAVLESPHPSPSTAAPESLHLSLATAAPESPLQSPATATPESAQPSPATAALESVYPSPAATAPESPHPSPATAAPESPHPSPAAGAPELSHPSPSATVLESQHPSPATAAPESPHPSPATAAPESPHPSPSTAAPESPHPSLATAAPESPHPSPATAAPESPHPSPSTAAPESPHPSLATAAPESPHPSPAATVLESQHPSPATAAPESPHQSPSTAAPESPHPSLATAAPESPHPSPATAVPESPHLIPSATVLESQHPSPATAAPESPHPSPSTAAPKSPHQSPSTAAPESPHQSPSTAAPESPHPSPSTAAPESPHPSLATAAPESPHPSLATAAPESPHPSLATAPPESPHQSLATAAPESPHPSLATAAPESPHPSLATAAPESPHPSPATAVPESPHPSPSTAAPESPHPSPSAIASESPLPSPATAAPEGSHQMSIQSPEEYHQDHSSITETNKNHIPPLEESNNIVKNHLSETLLQSPTASQEETYHSPAAPTDEFPQISMELPKKYPQIPTPNPEESHQKCLSLKKDPHKNDSPCLEKTCKSSSPLPSKTHQTVSQSLDQLNSQIETVSSNNNPAQSLKETLQSFSSCDASDDSPRLSPLNLQEMTALSPKVIHQSALPRPAEPKNLHQCSTQSNFSTGDDQDRLRLPEPGHAKYSSSFTSSHHALTGLLVTSSSPKSVNQESPTSHRLKPESLAQNQLGPTEVEFGPVSTRPCLGEQHSSLSVQNFTEGQQSSGQDDQPLQRHPAHSPDLCSPLQASSACIVSPTQEAEAMLDQPTSGADPPQNIFTVDPEAPSVYCSSTINAPRSCSAPCSPNPLLGEPRLQSLSQPASPVQPQNNQAARSLMFPMEKSLDSLLTLGRSSANLISTSDPPSSGSNSVHPSLPHARKTPESLDNSSTSPEHSSLTFSPCVQDTKVNRSPNRNPSPCPDAAPAPVNPAFCLKTCESPLPTETLSTPQTACSPTQPDSPKSQPVRSMMEPEQPQPAHTISGQDKDVEVHPDRLVQTENLMDSDRSSSQTDISPTYVHSSSSTFCPHTGSVISFVTASLTSIPSGGDSSPWASHVGQASPVDVVQTETPSPASPPHSPAGDEKMQHRTTPNTKMTTRLPQAPLTSASNSETALGLSMVHGAVDTTKALLDSSADHAANVDVEMCTGPGNSPAADPIPARPEHWAQSPDSPAQSTPNSSSPLYSDTAVRSSVITRDSPASPSGPAPSELIPPPTVFTSTFQAGLTSVSSPGKRSVIGTVDSESHQSSPTPGPVGHLKPSPNTGATSPLLPEPSPDAGVGCAGSASEEAGSAVVPVSPVPDCLSPSEIRLSPGLSGPVRSASGAGQQTVMACAFTGAEQRKTWEEQGEPPQAVLKSPEDVKPSGKTEGGADKEEECQRRLVPVCPPSDVQLIEPSGSTASPVPSATCPSTSSPPEPGFLAVPLSSSPGRTSLPVCSQSMPPKEDCPREAEWGKVEEEGDENSPSQRQSDVVATVTEPTKRSLQSHGETSDKQTMGTTGRQQMQEEEEVRPVKEYQLKVEGETLLSPVLDLNPSLDMEVMELMTSAAPTTMQLLSSSSPTSFTRRGKGRSLRPPPCSPRPSDDLSIRLRQSPFSTEASPETSPARTPVTPPPLTPPSPPSSRESPPFSQAAPTIVFPYTPKIGMGKPAISKRKFSPGRARSKQRKASRKQSACREVFSLGTGSWWSSRRAPSPPSSSQDSIGEGDWSSPKPHPPDSPLWSIKVGRGSGFPGRRRSRGGGVGGGRGGRGRSRPKSQDSVAVAPGAGYTEPPQAKEEEENSMHNTVVMFSTSDHFTLKQDMCVVCGSFGQGAEGRLLACSQCGQCYHPYCVNVKITRVVLTKGWRCLECTVCEACGDACDPARLLLCDDCDISYHTYCLDPPLLTVPKGSWKCKWCVWCVGCGSTSPGLRCDWLNNYSLCGPCSSLSQCPVCQRRYAQDELILQCAQCDRWSHGACQGLTSEEEVVLAADEGLDCSLCRTHGRASSGTADPLGPFTAHMVSRTREPDIKTYTQDGVCLTESGLTHLQSLVEPLTSPRKYRRPKPKLKLRIINQNSVSVLQTPPDPETPTRLVQNPGDLDCDLKSDSSPERDAVPLDDITKEADDKKRKRKPYRPGIGGFMVRQRGGKAGSGRKDSMEMIPSQHPGESGVAETEFALETMSAADQAMEKVKKRYRKKKTKLEEAFPSYLQEAFFGRDLLDRGRQMDRRAQTMTSGSSQSESAVSDTKGSAHKVPGSASSVQPLVTVTTSRKEAVLPMSSEALVDLSDVLNREPHILETGTPGQFQVERSPSPFAGLDIMGSVAGDPPEGCGRGQRLVQEEPLDAILSPELDKMVTDGGILSRLYKIPELEGKDVEELFTAVLSPGSSKQLEPRRASGSAAAGGPRLPVMNGLMPAAPPLPPGLLGFRPPPSEGPAPPPASANRPPAGEGEQEVPSAAQRGTLKWEKEESLGEQATVAPVLYCNTNFPQLKQQYPDWTSRVKQITKLWRKASSQDRAPFVQKARDNRAAQRINKVQLSNDALKRLQPSQPAPQPLGVYDHVSPEAEAGFKDPLRPRESEQEQEWKLRQIMRQKSKQLAKMEATQKLEQVKNEQRQQQLRQSGRLSPEGPAHLPVAGGNASPLQPGGGLHLVQEGSSAMADDIFLKPQVPPPSGFSSLPHSPLASSPLHQPPCSPQMFTPPSSRPSSPWDPYGKAAGTPRPSGAPTPQHQPRLGFPGVSPAHDTSGSPAVSPESSNPGLQQARAAMMSPASGSPPDPSVRQMRAAESLQRINLTVQGGLFKAPMPPQQELAGGARRDLSFLPTLELPFPSSPVSALGSPHRSPYAQTPGTPRPEFGQQPAEPLPHQSPLSSRPSPDPYRDPQTPGTPLGQSDSCYRVTPPTLRPDQIGQPPGGRHPSPSHLPLDSCVSNPGTPRPSERFPRSPGPQQSADPFSQPAGTLRPSPELYLQQTSTPRPQKAMPESFATQPAAPASSPLGQGLMPEAGTFHPAGAKLQRSPGHKHDSFPRPSSGRTSGVPEEGTFHAAGQGALEPGHTAQTDQSGAGDGAVGTLPQLGGSEEKVAQRLWLRQRLLQQQHQKIALRQEKGLLEPPAAGAAAPGTSLHAWPPEDICSAPAADPFGRPPPPYPGTGRPPAPGFAGGLAPAEAFPRQSLHRDHGVRGPAVRLGAPAGLQDLSLRPSLGAAPGLGSARGHLDQMRRPMAAEFTGIRSLMPPNPAAHMVPGVPQLVVQRPAPPQQHAVMPYIELRHRAPENRLRLPFPLPGPQEATAVPTRDPGQSAATQQQPGLDQQHMGAGASAVPGSVGMEEHLEGEDSAVKDLEDVEVKDLVDLNLNLDPEDGKEDLDLGPNDLHLDDFLLTGKFDLIAYADPELNLEDKKDMFNEELDLGEPAEEGGRASRKTDGPAHLLGQAKQEVKEAQRTGGPSSPPLPLAASRPPGTPSALLIKEKLEACGSVSGPALAVQAQEQVLSSVHRLMSPGEPGVFQQHQGPLDSSPVPQCPLPPGQTPQGSPTKTPLPQPLVNPQKQPPHTTSEAQSVSLARFPENLVPAQNQNKSRPLLLEEQPLLLQDLLDQERQEQQQQKQMQALIRHRSGPEAGFSNVDFESISDPIMKAKMQALKGINKVMSQGNLGLNPVVNNRFRQTSGAPGPDSTPQSPHPAGQGGALNPQLVRRNPPSLGPGFINESQRQQYEEWLGETQQLLQISNDSSRTRLQLIARARKSLSASRERPRGPIRKQQKDHTELIEDYRTKQQRMLQMPSQNPLGQPTPPSQTPPRRPHPGPTWLDSWL